MVADVKCHTYQLGVQGTYNLCLTLYWTSMLCAINGCQKRVSADQFHMILSKAQVYNSLRWCVFLLTSYWFSIDRRLRFFSGGIQFASYGENWSTSERHCLKDPRGASLLALAKSIQYILKQWVGFFARWLAAQSRNILHYLLIHLQFLRASDAKLT